MIQHYCYQCKHILINYDEKYCNACNTQVNKDKASRVDKDYQLFIKSNKWKKLSEQIREEQPMCERCKNLHKELIKPSKEVHHILKVRDYPELKFNKDNLVALCKECHKELTDKGY